MTRFLGVLTAALVLVVVAPAQAAKVDLAGGKTTLKLDRGTAAALTAAGVSVSGSGVFPITGGRIDPATGAGRIDHRGGLRIAAGSRSVRLSKFRIQNGNLSAVAGGARLHVAKLRGGKLRRTATTTRIARVRVELTGKAARALNAALHTSLFARGVPLGRATVDAKLAQIAPRGGSTALAVDPGALSALTSLGITPGLVDPASADKSGAFRFPITGGVVDAKTLAGRIRHSGGISLTKGSTVVELTRFDIEISGTPQLTALVGGTRVPILDLDLSGITTSVKGLRVTVSGVRATLTAEAAGALNQAFGTTAFQEGLLLGIATVRARL